MTKERLRAYRALKIEQRQLERLVRESGSEKLHSLYREKLAKVEAEQLEIEQAIDSLDSMERAIMRHYYIDGMTWEAVCCKVNYEWAQIHRIHGEILKKLKH